MKLAKSPSTKLAINNLKTLNISQLTFNYDGGEVPPIRIDGNFRVFKFDNKSTGRPSYSLAIKCEGENQSFFKRLNSVLAERACSALKGQTPESFELLRENKYGCIVFAKIYMKKTGKPRCRVSKGSHKNPLELDDLVDENFRGSYILRVYQAYVGSSKTISISVEEILVKDFNRKSYFIDEVSNSSDDSDNE